MRRVYLLALPVAFAYALIQGDWLPFIVWSLMSFIGFIYLVGKQAGIRQAGEALAALAEVPPDYIATQREAAENQ